MAWSRIGFSIILFTVATASWAQVNRYMVFFTDKTGSPYSITQPDQFLSQRAIDRRIRQGIPVFEEDVPVNPGYVQGLRDVGASVFFRSRWMNGVLIQCDAPLVPSIEVLPYVTRVELVAPNARLLDNGRKDDLSEVNNVSLATQTQAQLQLIGLDDMQDAGYKGETLQIGIFDGGFQGVDTAGPFQHLFDNGRVDLTVSKDFVHNSSSVFQFDDHGTQVFSVIAAYQAESFTGGAYEATYQLYVTEDVSTEYRIEEFNWLFAAERADSAGVDVINSSLGYYDFDNAAMNYSKSAMDGKTTVVTRAARFAAERGIVVVCSAGNEGAKAWQIITAPADARDVLAIANVNSSGQRAGSSSIGPSADGRVKPDVAAMGVNTTVIRADGSVGFASGTSLSSPLVTSLVAGVWQRYPGLTNIEVIDAIRKSASQASSPDNLLGYGIPNFKAVVNYLESSSQESVFEVYPNPVQRDTVTIVPFDPNQITSCHVELLSSQGQVVYDADVSFSWLNRYYTADISRVAAGIYFLRIWWGENRFTFKLVKV